MKNSVRLIGALLFGSVSLVALSAHADEPAGWYVGANGGLNWNNKIKTDLAPTTTGQRFTGTDVGDSSIKEKEGWAGAAEVGYNWGMNIRTEIEGMFAENSVRRVRSIGGSGRTDIAAGFVNAFYDFDLTQFNIALPIVPYIGAGVGAEYWGQQSTFPEGVAGAVPVSGNGFAFAYQAIGGIAYNVDDNWAVTADFRYIDTPAAEFGNNRPRFVTNDLTTEQVLLGVRYTFAAPQPVAPPPPPQAPYKAPPAKTATVPAQSQYLVFFDFNRYNLTTDAARIVDNAAAAAKSNSGVTRIDVTGHTDTVGSDAYNMRLSRRRADTVKAELVRQGVSAKENCGVRQGQARSARPDRRQRQGASEPSRRDRFPLSVLNVSYDRKAGAQAPAFLRPDLIAGSRYTIMPKPTDARHKKTAPPCEGAVSDRTGKPAISGPVRPPCWAPQRERNPHRGPRPAWPATACAAPMNWLCGPVRPCLRRKDGRAYRRRPEWSWRIPRPAGPSA